MNKRICSAGLWVCVAAAMLLCACAPAQGAGAGGPLRDYLLRHSIELTGAMDAMAESPEYLRLITQAPEIADAVAEIGEETYTSPHKAVLIEVPDATMGAVLESVAPALTLPENAYEMTAEKLLSGIPSFLNARQGVQAVAVTNVLAAGGVVPKHEDLSANIYVLLVYDTYASLTLFLNSDTSAIAASSSFLFLNEEMRAAVAEETLTAKELAGTLVWLFPAGSGEVDLSGITVEYISEDALPGKADQ